jgi:DNA polymerase-3 subunit alpha
VAEINETKPAEGKRTVPGFVHLHNHSHYSLLDGLAKIPEMVDRVKELGMEAVALTDHGAMYGTIEFYKACLERGVKPIIGVEAYVAPRRHDQKEPRVDANPYHLILLAENNKGYKNLLALTTIAHLDGYYYKPRIDREIMKKYSEGLICLSGCMQGEVARYILAGNLEAAEKAAIEHREIYGKDNYFLELQHHPGFKEQETINREIRKLSKKLDIPLVVTRDSHYVSPGDREAHDILLCVQTGKTVGDTDRMEMEGEISLCGPDELAEAFSDEQQAMTNTVEIARRCKVEITLGKTYLPHFPLPEGKTSESYLAELCDLGVKFRYGEKPPKEVMDRLKFELGVISRMGYESYFLIIHDFISWSKDQGILIGPGRGSAAGSVVAYVLKITDIDPIKYDLLFERFLNPERISMPDIDMDFADDRRDEVIQYVTEKYGADHVAQIITFGTMASRASVRDTGRALGMSYGEVDVVAKLIPPNIKLGEAIVQVEELRAEYNGNSRVRKLLDMAARLEGVVRHASVHAAGVVISKDPLVNYTPLQRATKGENAIVTQYSMGPIEEIGLLKMDFLGLSNLTILGNALKIIKATTGDEIDLAHLPLDDMETYRLLSEGCTTGVFQLESAGMKRHIRELQPSVFEDIIAMVALYRPGPMQWIPDFIARKHGKQKVEYLHPSMKEALENTYGVIVYQEQVMQIAKSLCGFTGGQADTLRKGIGKKIPAVLAKMKKDFIEGAIEHSKLERAKAETLWTSLEDFAQYCFNKSHAACYAMIAYQTAYLKTHYPAQFMAALMTSDQGDTDRIAIDVDECRRMGIEVLAPSVQESFSDFTAIKGAMRIRFGLAAIKNVGMGAVDSIVTAREASGIFRDLEDFLSRVDSTALNRKVLESLIKAGAMDELGDRSDLLANLEELVNFASEIHKRRNAGQTDIFGALGEEARPTNSFNLYPAREKIDNRDRLAWEKELIGLYISEHPLDSLGDLRPYAHAVDSLHHDMNSQQITLIGILTQIKKIQTRSNETMLFATIEDKSGSVELIVFPRTLREGGELWSADRIVRVGGKVSTKDRDGKYGNEIKIIVDTIEEFSAEKLTELPTIPESEMTIPSSEPKLAWSSSDKLVVELPRQASDVTLSQLRDLISDAAGSSPVSLVVWQGEQQKHIQLKNRVTISKNLLSSLSNLVGEAHVSLKPSD